MNALTLRNTLPATIFSGRVTLRAPAHADVPALVALANNRKIHDVLANLPHPYTSAEALDFVENITHSADQRPFAITGRDDRLIGVVGLKFDETLPEIGYWLGEPYWGKGYATEAVKALIAATEATRRFPTLGARALAHNFGSINVLTKAGFIETHRNNGRCGVYAGVEVVHFRREAEL